MSATGHIRPAPASCEEYGYGLGRPSGILVFRYRSAGALEFGANRQDFLHQLYWSPDGMLSTVYGRHSRFVGPQEGFWSERAVNHEVRAADRQTVYRICLRQTPEALGDLRIGPVEVDRDVARLIEMLGGPGCEEEEALRAREHLMTALRPSAFDVTANAVRVGRRSGGVGPPPVGPPPGGVGAAPSPGPAGHGHALAVARALSHDPSDDTPLDEWAARLHISAKTLQRDFLREFGMPYTHWRTRLRLRTARVLLGVEAVTTVAHRVGYASPSAFVAAFAKEYGETPGRYVRALRRNDTF
ncbi:AraC family transcriptional regulator [Streptomyces sp. NPDC005963]|uniref:helix-turn-helix transcriptional regulator n=1 Tax=Streptomyces sp. NPDC005963 TaxID=3156721 RepID=UPI0033FFC081